MQWLSKKFLIKSLKIYFDIEDESKIDVDFKLLNIFGKHSIQCKNLKLKSQKINTNDMIIHIQSCIIQNLQIIIDSSKQQLLSTNINGIKIRLKFNANKQATTSAANLVRPELVQFKKLLTQQQVYEKLNYFSPSPITKLILQQILSKTNLNIKNIDISLKYGLHDKVNIDKYIGFAIGQLNIRQKIIDNQNYKFKDKEIQCNIKDFDIYLGTKVDKHHSNKDNFHKDTSKSKQYLHKRYLLEKNSILIHFNQDTSAISISSQLLQLSVCSFYIKQLLLLIKQTQPLFSKSPKLRPGQGKMLISGVYKFSQGTSQWWKFIGQSLLEKIKQREKFNIIQNKQYRLYLYSLLYCYTYGAKVQYLNFIKDYQCFKTSIIIMNSHRFIIQKIYKIQHQKLSELQQLQLKGFVRFLSIKPKKATKISSPRLSNFQKKPSQILFEKRLLLIQIKQIPFNDIKKSDVFINFSNCLKFIEEFKKKTNQEMGFQLHIKSIKLNIIQVRQQTLMYKDIYQQHPQCFHMVKNILFNRFKDMHFKDDDKTKPQTKDKQTIQSKRQTVQTKTRNMTNPSTKQHLKLSGIRQVVNQHQKLICCLQVHILELQKTQSTLILSIQSLKITQPCNNKKLLKVQNLSITNQYLQRYSNKQNKILLEEKSLQIKIATIFINPNLAIITKLLMINKLINDKKEQQYKDDFLNNIINHKIPKDRIFNTYQNQNININVQNITIATSLFDKDKILQITLSKLDFYSPIQGDKKISLQKIQVKRTTSQRTNNWKQLSQSQSIILENDCSFTGIFSSHTYQLGEQNYCNPVSYGSPREFSSLGGSSNHRKPTTHKLNHISSSCFNLVIPFLFIQLSCQDIYYFMLFSRYWRQLIENPYIFAATKKTFSQQNPSHNPATIKFVRQISQTSRVCFQTHVKLHGIQFIFYGDNLETQEYYGANRIVTLMIDNITFDKEERIKKDFVQVEIKNIYIRNMLGNDFVNIHALDDIFKQQIQKKSKIVVRKPNQKPTHNLIMYNHFTQQFQVQDKVPFIKVQLQKRMDIQKLRGQKICSISIKSFQIFHQPSFFSTITQIINHLQVLSIKQYEQNHLKFIQRSFHYQQECQFEVEQKRQKQILYKRDFSVSNQVNVKIDKVNFIVLENGQNIYCFHLYNTHLNHKAEFYVANYNIYIDQFYIIDISKIAAPHQFIFQSTWPIKINFTQYNCELLKQRYKRSALMKIQINNAKIHFLNKKIMELVNFILQLKEDILGKSEPESKNQNNQKNNKNQQKKQNQQKDKQNDHPFCYQIMINSSQMILYRNSLSAQCLDCRFSSLMITNYRQKSQQGINRKSMGHFYKRKGRRMQITQFLKQFGSTAFSTLKKDIPKQVTKRSSLYQQPQNLIDSPLNQTLYQEMQQIQQNDFKSFVQDDEIKDKRLDQIWIQMGDFYVVGRHRENSIILIPQIRIIFAGNQLTLNIPQIQMNLDTDYYRLLIRITQENFAQPDFHFHINPIFKTQKLQKFITKFNIQIIKINCIQENYGVYETKDKQNVNKQSNSNKIHTLTIVDLFGKDISFTNGQKLTQLSIIQLYAQNSSMIQFMQHSTNNQNDPKITIYPHTIHQSQQQFSFYNRIFQNIKNQDNQFQDFVLSDLNDNKLNKKEYNQEEQGSNCQKLVKWIKGMCDKCFYCLRKRTQQVTVNKAVKNILQQQVATRQHSSLINPHSILCQGNPNISFIFSQQQVLNQVSILHPQRFYSLLQKSNKNQIYMKIQSLQSKQKKMYILVKDIVMTYDIDQGLMKLAQFFGKPYSQTQDQQNNVVKAKWNNYRPIQMYIQLKDAKIQMKKDIVRLETQHFQKIIATQKIVIFIDAIYNQSTMGDLANGPGKSLKQADIIFQLFHACQKSGKIQFTQLSNLIQMIYRNQTKVSYEKQQQTKYDQKILIKAYNDKQSKQVRFYVPAFYIKTLIQIYQNTFTKKSVPAQINQKHNISIDNNCSSPKNLVLQSDANLQLQSNPILTNNQLPLKLQRKQSSTQKIEKIIDQSKMKRKIYLPGICVDLESKIRTSFVKINSRQLVFSMITENVARTQKTKFQCNSQLSIDYWNLNIADFQPVLEPWNFKLIVKNIKRQNTLSKKIKLQSFNRQSDSQQLNWLNINISTAFFHTFKQLQLKYHQGRQQAQQQCIDVTYPQLQKYLSSPLQSLEPCQPIMQVIKKSQFPENMKNFFGRKFVIQQQILGKKKHDYKNVMFHQSCMKYCLYHSYFDHQLRKKVISYRTPFRLINCANIDLLLNFKIKHKSAKINSPKFFQWTKTLNKDQYFAFPRIIYKTDFLINISKDNQASSKRKNRNSISIKKLPLQNLHKREFDHMHEQDKQPVYLSCQYLMQIHSQKSQFKKNYDSKILAKLFSADQRKGRYIDPRDILLKINHHTLALICTKSQYQNQTSKSKSPFYDTLVAIISPIEIFNNSPIPLNVILNTHYQHSIPPHQISYISQGLDINNILSTVIQFRQHILHRQWQFLKSTSGTNVFYMQIDRMQSLNLRLTKQTVSTFTIEIFPDWIIQNFTDQQFQLNYAKKIFPIDKMSKSCLAIQNYAHGNKIQMLLNIYSSDDSKQYPYKLTTNGTQVTQLVTMFKKIPDQIHQQIIRKKQLLKQKKLCCIKSYPFTQATYQKQSSQIYGVYSFILKIYQKKSQKNTKTISIRYKTKMINKTNKLLQLYQYSTEFKIAHLYPGNQICVWGYDFLPEHYLIRKTNATSIDILQLNKDNSNNQLIRRTANKQEDSNIKGQSHGDLSEKFLFDQSLGKQVTIKFKKNMRSTGQVEYHKNFDYLKMQIQQLDHSSSYAFTQLPSQSAELFPIYIHNTTQQSIKIYENEQQFLVKPKSKVPFSWSNLIHNSHEISVQIGQIKKTYSFKQNQQFQPIVIKDQMGGRQRMIKQPKTNFYKEVLRVKYGLVEGRFQTIVDVKQNMVFVITGYKGLQYKFDMKKATKITTSAQSIQINLGARQQSLVIYPSSPSYQTWLNYLNFSVNQHILTKVSFTIQTYKNSRLFFFHNVELGRQNDYLTSVQQFYIENLFISVVNDKPEEVILFHFNQIKFTREDRICRLGYDNYQIQKCDRKLEIKEIKINNQLQNAVNPVILTQIKKSNTPFISILTKKRNLVKSQSQISQFEFRDQMITHFESFSFFLDEAQCMVQASLIPKLLSLQQKCQKIQSQYHISLQKPQQQSGSNVSSTSSYQLYLSFLQIRPIKMTISVSFQDLSKDLQSQRMNLSLLNMLPVGIQNAIITIDSYMFYHIYQDKTQVMKQINQFYWSELTKQVLVNAGNLQFLVAIDLVKGLGVGVKSIFYDPIYEFASNKDIKNSTSTLFQGLFTLIIFLISFFIKLNNLIFKTMAILTFDRDYKAKREIFRKQIFKSPLQGCIFGGKYFLTIFKSFLQDLKRLPRQYYQNYYMIGCFLGLLLGIINVIPWIIKLFITLYDWIYVIGIGFISWGHYQENAMKNRSRPSRIFHHKKLNSYSLLQAKAYQIMRNHNIKQTEKQNILYVRDVDSEDQTTNSYLILSDYSLLYSDNNLTIFDEIILYKISLFKVIWPIKKTKSKKVHLQITLKTPNIRKFIFISIPKYQYIIKFKQYFQLCQLLDKLRQLKLNKNDKYNYQYEIIDQNYKKQYTPQQNKFIQQQQYYFNRIQHKKNIIPYEYNQTNQINNQNNQMNQIYNHNNQMNNHNNLINNYNNQMNNQYIPEFKYNKMMRQQPYHKN